MNNKKGGFGARLVLVLILMIASAIGGAYAYRIMDGKMAVRDAQKEIDAVKVSEYDTDEAKTVQGYIDDARKNLETAKTRKEVYEIMTEFDSDVDGVLTKLEKELEEARKAVDDAKKNSSGSSNDSSSGSSSGNEEETDSSESKSSGGLFGNLLGGSSSDDTEEETEDSSGSSIFD